MFSLNYYSRTVIFESIFRSLISFTVFVGSVVGLDMFLGRVGCSLEWGLMGEEGSRFELGSWISGVDEVVKNTFCLLLRLLVLMSGHYVGKTPYSEVLFLLSILPISFPI